MGLFSRLLPRRETAADRQSWLQTTVRSAALQVGAHHQANLLRAARSFESAETPPWTESWPTHCGAINQDLQQQLPTLIARARGIARNNEWARKYLHDLHDNVSGATGIRLQVRLYKPQPAGATTPPDPDKASSRILEELWCEFWERPDVAGYTGLQVEKLALESEERDGAILLRRRPGAGPFGWQLQLMPVTLLDVTLNRDWGGNRIRMGVEINDSGAQVAYWLLLADPNDSPVNYITVGRHVRIPASELHHGFDPEEIGQIRGIPGLIAGARRLWLTKSFEEAAAVASVNAARRQGFFVSPDGEAPRGFADEIVSAALTAAKAEGRTLSADEINQITAAAEKYATTMPGQFDTLPAGYDFKAFESKWPDVNSEGFIKSHLRAWSSARGASYNSIGNDLESVNYSSAQVGIIAEREHYKRRQTNLIANLHAVVWPAVLPYLILRAPGTLKMSRLQDYIKAATWQGRRWAPIDPEKGAKANEIRLRTRTTTRRRIWLEDGQDPDEMQAEVDADQARNGAVPTAEQAAQQPNPDPATE